MVKVPKISSRKEHNHVGISRFLITLYSKNNLLYKEERGKISNGDEFIERQREKKNSKKISRRYRSTG